MKDTPANFTERLHNRTLLMMFEKPSTRTRVSFEAGMTQLGGHAIYFHSERSHLKRGEGLGDTAKVLSRYCDAVMARLYEHEKLRELRDNADIPVINGLTNLLHPCQAIADLYTLQEKGMDFEEMKLTYVGDGNNVAHSLMQTCATLGVDCCIGSPEAYAPDTKITDTAKQTAAAHESDVEIVHDPQEAAKDADVLYTDVWISMHDDHSDARRRALRPYQVNEELLEHAAPDVKVMHCLPAHRGEEITSAVMDGDHSIIFDQAENRMHVQKAILDLLVNG